MLDFHFRISPPKVIHDTKLLVSNNGEILWVSHIQYDMTCVTSPAQEESECEMKFGSWTLNTELLRLTSVSETLDLANYVDHVEWVLAQSFVTTSVFEYPCCPGGTVRCRVILVRVAQKDEERRSRGSFPTGSGVSQSFRSPEYSRYLRSELPGGWFHSRPRFNS